MRSPGQITDCVYKVAADLALIEQPHPLRIPSYTQFQQLQLQTCSIFLDEGGCSMVKSVGKGEGDHHDRRRTRPNESHSCAETISALTWPPAIVISTDPEFQLQLQLHLQPHFQTQTAEPGQVLIQFAYCRSVGERTKNRRGCRGRQLLISSHKTFN